MTASAQTTANCNAQPGNLATVASTGLAEQIGDIVLICSGGTSGLLEVGAVYVTLNTNITNALDTNGNPLNVTFTASPGVTVTAAPLTLASSTTIAVSRISYTVPNPSLTPVTMTIHGIRAAVASIQNGMPVTQVTATLATPGFNLTGNQFAVAFGATTVNSSTLNNGISCGGSPVPATIDYPSFVAAGTTSSAIRVTEAVTGAWAPASASTTNGTRVLVQLSGYGTGVRLFVPDAIVGTTGLVQTSDGQFATGVASGTYAPSSNQLLLSRVSGTDQNGVGGTLVTAKPGAVTTFTSVSELTVTNGSAYAVYEVLDYNPNGQESFQVPVFVANAGNNCGNSLQTDITAELAPVSTVSVATATDPIPRYIASVLTSDCQITGDCAASYFPTLTIATTPIAFTGSSLGAIQTASIPMTNNGGSQLNLAISIAYQSVSGWLTATPVSSGGALSLAVSANPTVLQAGVYAATVNINAGVAGTAAIPVTFTVGPEGITIQAIVNAASFQTGPVAPGAYVALFGLDLAGTSGTGTNPTVTFNGLSANVIYSSATQINLIVPSSLSGQTSAAVVVGVSGQVSNSFTVALTPNEPGIFTPGILNSDSSVNSVSKPATRGTFIQVYLTGLALPAIAGSITVNMGSQTGIATLYAGAQPTYPALDQVNVTIPASLTFTGNSTPLAVCVSSLLLSAPVCSNSVTLYVQ